MRLLVLGGTKFLGRGIVDAALAGGHSVTLFNRGQTNPSLYPDVESLLAWAAAAGVRLEPGAPGELDLVV